MGRSACGSVCLRQRVFLVCVADFVDTVKIYQTERPIPSSPPEPRSSFPPRRQHLSLLLLPNLRASSPPQSPLPLPLLLPQSASPLAWPPRADFSPGGSTIPGWAAYVSSATWGGRAAAVGGGSLCSTSTLNAAAAWCASSSAGMLLTNHGPGRAPSVVGWTRALTRCQWTRRRLRRPVQ